MLEDNLTDINDNKSSQRYYLIYAILTAIFLGLISQALSYYFNFNYAYRDSIFRSEAARRFFDSDNPGIINQIGTVWLPVPNLILMPFVYVDYLWRTGLAASLVNFPSFVISSVVIFFAIRKLTNNVLATWFGFVVFVFNYNILYFQTTSMTEQLYLTFLICSFYFLLLWVNDKQLKHLIYSSLFISLSVGTRYDAWPVAIVSIGFVFIISFIVVLSDSLNNPDINVCLRMLMTSL